MSFYWLSNIDLTVAQAFYLFYSLIYLSIFLFIYILAIIWINYD